MDPNAQAPDETTRWQQRQQRFAKALAQLDAACRLRQYNEIERAGLVQIFTFTFELAWETLKDRLLFEGFEENSPRAVFRRGFASGLLSESGTETLLDALQKRNLLSHTYQEQVATMAVSLIKERYFPALQALHDNLSQPQC